MMKTSRFLAISIIASISVLGTGGTPSSARSLTVPTISSLNDLVSGDFRGNQSTSGSGCRFSSQSFSGAYDDGQGGENGVLYIDGCWQDPTPSPYAAYPVTFVGTFEIHSYLIDESVYGTVIGGTDHATEGVDASFQLTLTVDHGSTLSGSRIEGSVMLSGTWGNDPGSADYGPATGQLIGSLRQVPLPGAPSVGSAIALDKAALLTWKAPTPNGGDPISGYVVTPYVNGVARLPRRFTSKATKQTITSLSNGVAYRFKVAAVSAVGTGAQSGASNSVTPRPK